MAEWNSQHIPDRMKYGLMLRKQRKFHYNPEIYPQWVRQGGVRRRSRVENPDIHRREGGGSEFKPKELLTYLPCKFSLYRRRY